MKPFLIPADHVRRMRQAALRFFEEQDFARCRQLIDALFAQGEQAPELKLCYTVCLVEQGDPARALEIYKEALQQMAKMDLTLRVRQALLDFAKEVRRWLPGGDLFKAVSAPKQVVPGTRYTWFSPVEAEA